MDKNLDETVFIYLKRIGECVREERINRTEWLKQHISSASFSIMLLCVKNHWLRTTVL